MQYKFTAEDESGDIGVGEGASKYLVLASFLYDDENWTRKIRKFIKDLNHNKSGTTISVLHARYDSDVTRLKVVKFLRQNNDWGGVVVVEKKVPHRFKFLETLKFLLSQIKISEKLFLSLPTTKFDIKKQVIDIDGKIELHTPKSKSTIQMADFIAWVVFKKYEHNDDTYFKLLEGRLKIVEMQNPYITNELPSGSST